MDWDFGAVNQIADNVLIAVGIVVLIVRQFLWRSADPRRMMRLPALVVGAGILLLADELGRGFRWMPGDWLLVAELVLVAATGTAMGWVTRFRTVGEQLEYRLTGAGIGLWAVFVGVRLGVFVLASMFGANLAGASGLVLLSFGVNRLAASLVVRRRVLASAENGCMSEQKKDIPHELSQVTKHWTPRIIGQVNDQYIKVAKLLGELVWHAHDNEDEMFLVASGHLRIQLEGRDDVHLGPGQFFVVPRGVRHNPVADEEVEIVLIETVTTAHTGDVIVEGTVPVEQQLAG